MPNGPGDPDKIAAAIRASGLSYRALARRMGGISDTSVSNYANGLRKPAAGNLARLAQALGVDVRSLLA
jgi:transcriptional regulator with XRE-family HTH domain